MQKLIVFDLDGTLAKLAKPITNSTVTALKKLTKAGHIVAVCSGKPTYYLCGMLRQTGLSAPIYIGENGATFQFGVDLPPQKNYIYPYNPKSKEQIDFISKIICNRCGDDIWCQPNEVVFTPFPKKQSAFEVIRKIISEHKSELTELTIYEHGDCFDFIPKAVNKQNGVKYLAELLNINRENIIAVGDGVNDYSMFEIAEISCGINLPDPDKATHNFKNINSALAYVQKICQ